MKKLIPTALVTLSCLVSAASADTFYIDFGSYDHQTSPNWNNITGLDNKNKEGTSFALINSLGEASDLALVLTTKFNGNDNRAVIMSGIDSGTLDFPDTATMDSLYAEDNTTKGPATPTFTFTGLDPTLNYTFETFASTIGPEDIRSATYTATGVNTESGTLNASNNTSDTITLSNITPTSDGTITFSITKGADNDSKYGSFYLGTLKITETPAIPEASSAALLIGISSMIFLLIRRRKS